VRLPVFALFSYSVRLDSRLKVTYLARMALIGMMLFLMMVFRHNLALSGVSGLEFLSLIMMINVCFISMLALSSFSSAITEEKEEQTLGLLRLTSLGGLSILFGKSTSRLFGALLLLLVQLPFTLLAITLGGITIHQIAASYLTLLCYTVLLSTVALLASVCCKRHTGAAALTLLFLFAFFGGPALMDGLVHLGEQQELLEIDGTLATRIGLMAQTVRDIRPDSAMQQIFAVGYSEPLFSFQVSSNLALALLCFAAAWFWFHFWGHHDTQGETRRLPRFWKAMRGKRAKRAWPAALAWKEFTFLAQGRVALLIKCLLLTALCWLFHYVLGRIGQISPAEHREKLGILLMSIYSVLLLTELAYLGSHVFHQEVQQRTLSSLVLLPISVPQLAYSKIAGCLLAVLPTVAFLCFACWLAPTALREFVSDEPAKFGYLLSLAVFFIHLSTMLSLTVKNGAIALAFFGTLIGRVMLAAFLDTFVFENLSDGQDLRMITECWMLAWASLFLHVGVGLRLKTLAAR